MIIGWLLFIWVLTFSFLQVYLYMNFGAVPYLPLDRDVELPFVSVVVAVKNEEEHIFECVESLIRQDYPADRYEIIIVDDHSEDDTIRRISGFDDIRVISQKTGRNGKKEAVITGVKHAKGEIILMTDGDCVATSGWISAMVETLASKDAQMVTGPVSFVQKTPGSFIERYQILEQSALNVITGAGLKTGLVLSASGANMGFRKDVFSTLDPYQDNRNLASGDDVFLVQAARHHKMHVVYCHHKNAVVFTGAVPAFSQLVRQRIRWGGKSLYYVHRPTQIYLILFILAKISLVLLLFFSFFRSDMWSFFFFGFSLTFLSDFILIQKGMRWLHSATCWQDVVKASVLQTFLALYISFAILTQKPVKWKGRALVTPDSDVS